MKNYKIKDLVRLNILLLIPLIIYGVFKNGYLLYEKDLINLVTIFKPVYLVLIGVIIKIVIDLIKNKRIIIDYNLLFVILLGMIMPYDINLLLYAGLFTITYIITLFIEKYIKFNKVCFIYLIIILIHFLINDVTFKTPLELNYTYSFEFIDLLIGRTVGGISSTSILFSLIAYVILISNFYYKKDIPLTINITYFILSFIYFIITNNNSYLLNSDLIFGSVFISTLPLYSPYKINNQILYGIFIGVISFIISISFDSVISIYLATFIISLFQNVTIKQNKTKLPIES